MGFMWRRDEWGHLDIHRNKEFNEYSRQWLREIFSWSSLFRGSAGNHDKDKKSFARCIFPSPLFKTDQKAYSHFNLFWWKNYNLLKFIRSGCARRLKSSDAELSNPAHLFHANPINFFLTFERNRVIRSMNAWMLYGFKSLRIAFMRCQFSHWRLCFIISSPFTSD